MSEKKSRPRTRKPAAKKPDPKPKPAPEVPSKEIWRCAIDWVRYRGTRYERGETVLVLPETMTASELLVLKRYFQLMPTGIMTGVSEPVEPLDEGENHGDHRS